MPAAFEPLLRAIFLFSHDDMGAASCVESIFTPFGVEYLGRLEEGLRGRKTETKALIIVAVEEDGMGIGRIRMRHIADASATRLHAFDQESIAAGSIVDTDGWAGYSGLADKGFVHDVTILKGRKESASELLPRVISLLKRWLMGTHQGAVSHKHLDEFTFRFNRRISASRGKLFFRLAQQAVAVEPTPYDAIVQQKRSQSERPKLQLVAR